MEKVIVSIREAFEEEKNKCKEKEQEWLAKEKAYQEKETCWQAKEKDWTDERKRFGEREEILKKKLLEDEKPQKEWEKAMQEWLAKEKAYQEKETQWQVKEKNWADERKRFEDKEEILKQKLLEYEKQQSDDPKDPTVIKLADEEVVKVTEVLKAAVVSSTEPRNTAGEAEVVEVDTELTKPQTDIHADPTSTEPTEGKRNRRRKNKKNVVDEVKDLKESPTAPQEEPTEPEFEVANTDLAKTKQVDQEDPIVIKVSDKAVAEASKIQDSKESSGEARVVGSAEPKDNNDSTSTKTSDNEVTESKSEVTKPPITKTNSDVEKEAKTTGEASSLLITPQETEKIVDESTQTNATASQNSVADPSLLNKCYLLRLHKLPKKRTDNNLESANNNSSRNERSKNRKGRNRKLHWSQRPELVTVVSKEPQTEPREAEIKAEDEVCNTDLAMPQLEDHKDLTIIIKPADEEGVEVKEAQDSKDSSVEAEDVSSTEPKDTAGEAEVVEAVTELTKPQIDVDVDSTSTEPKEGNSNRRRRNKKKNVVEEVKDLKESPTAPQEEPKEPEFEVANIDLAKTKQVDQEDPTVINVSDKAVVEVSKIQDSKESSGEAGVVGSAEPKDNNDSTSTKTSDNEVTVSKSEVTKLPITETNSDKEKEAKTTGEASSLLITPQETEKTVDESTQSNTTASQNSVADSSPLNKCYLLRLHKLPKKRNDNNLESANSSSRNERSKNRKGRNRQLHWSQRPELVTVVSKEPQTEPQEAEIKAEDEVSNTDLAMPQLEDHKDLIIIIKPADEEEVEVKEAQDSKDSSVEAADVSSAEPKDTAGEAEVVEADTELTKPQKDVDVDSTSTEPTKEKRKGRRKNKKGTGDDTTNLLSREWFF